jgi:hypothetical protein
MAENITKTLANEGKLLEAGWQTYRLLCLKKGFHDPADDLHEAFVAGAEHLFSSIMNMLDPGLEETDGDMQRMNNIANEIEPIRKMLQLKYGLAKGRA